MASQTTQELALARLDDAIGRVCSVPEACARDPGRDFTRSRKLPLPKLVRLMVTWGGDTIPVELNDAFGISISPADLDPENFNSAANMWKLIESLF